MQKLKEFYNKKTALLEIINQEKEFLKKYNLPILVERLEGIEKKIENIKFNIFVAGGWASGKTSLINILLGENYFPSAIFPAGAFDVEICYGESKKILLFPIDESEPDEIPYDGNVIQAHLKKYTQNANNETKSIYKKVVVYLPIDILKYGIQFVDTIATYSMENKLKEIRNYCQTSDMFVYCVSARMPYTGGDADYLRIVNMYGVTNPIIATTFFGDITYDMNQNEIMECMNTTYEQFYSKHTSKEYCFYLDSLKCKKAKEGKIREDIFDSGYEDFEKYIDSSLSDKANMSLKAIADEFLVFNENLVKVLDNNTSVEISDCKTTKNVSDKMNFLTKELYKTKIIDFGQKIDKVIPILIEKIQTELSIADFEPSTSFSIWHPKKCAPTITYECIMEAKENLTFILYNWFETDIAPLFNIMQNEIMIDKSLISKNTKSNFIESVVDIIIPNNITALLVSELLPVIMRFGATAHKLSLLIRDEVEKHTKKEINANIAQITTDVKKSFEALFNETCDELQRIIDNEAELDMYFVDFSETENNNSIHTDEQINKYKNIILFIEKTQDKLKSDFTH